MRHGPTRPSPFSLQTDQLHFGTALVFIQEMTGVPATDSDEDRTEEEAGSAGVKMDDAEVFMREMVELASKMLVQLRHKYPRARWYTHDVGVIGPMYVVAVTTADTSLRARALRVMEEANMREGFWDGPALQLLMKRVFRVVREKKMSP